MWNLVAGQQTTWRLHALHPSHLETHRLELVEAFGQDHAEGERPTDRVFMGGPGYTVEPLLMDHRTPVAVYVVREPARDWSPAEIQPAPARLRAVTASESGCR
jgi:hypothetical protein